MARSILRRALGKAARISGLRRPGPAILMYHRVTHERYDPWGLAVAPERFAQQLDWLARHRRVMPLETLVDLQVQGKLPRNACAITFDDGYECNALRAAPLLAQRGMCATFFLASRLLDPEREFWWDDLERIVTGAQGNRLSLDGETGNVVWTIGDGDPADAVRAPGAPPATSRQHAIDGIWKFLLPQSPAAIRAHIGSLREQAGVPEGARQSHRPMSREQAAALPRDTIAFGGHTLHHISMPDRPVDEQRHEIETGIAECAQLRGDDIRVFAYPYGHHDAQGVDLVRAAGVKGACSTIHGTVKRGGDAFVLPRVAIGNWTAEELRSNLAGA